MAKFLVQIVFTVMAVVVVFAFAAKLYTSVAGGSEDKAVLENFRMMESALSGIVENDFGQANMLLTLEKDYTLIGFSANDPLVKACIQADRDPTYTKPEECGGINNGCLCLYEGKVEDKNILSCKIFKDTKFYSRYDQKTFKPESFGCEQSGFPKSDHITDVKYEYLVFYGARTFTISNWGTQNLYIESKKENEINHVYIAVYDDNVIQREKFVNICPDKSQCECARKHFDKVLRNVNCGEEEYTEAVCVYDSKEEVCVLTENFNCTNGKIEEFCACGDTAYDSGYCLGEKYYPFISEECNLIKSCENYHTETTCVYDFCQLENKCFPELKDSEFEKCKLCESGCSCDIYTSEWMKQLNPCDCNTYNEDGYAINVNCV